MADTLPNVILPSRTPVDLYAATGITVGTKVRVQNITSDNVRVYSGATSPDMGTSGASLLYPSQTGENQTGDAGLWAWSVSGGAVQVVEVI